MRLLGRLRSSAPGPAFSNVLTPARIPEFCIPPRLPLPSPPQPSPQDAVLPRRCAAEPDLWLRSADDEGAGRTDWDPRSQAALSLPHLPRARTAYGFCALLESPHTRRKESLFLGDPGAAAAAAPLCAPRPHSAPRPRAHTYCAGAVRPRPARGGERDAPPAAPPASAPAPAGPQPTADSAAARPRGRRLLRAPDGLLGRALRACGSRGSARARSASGRVKDEVERDAAAAAPESPISAPARPSPAPGPRPERLEAEGTVALSRAGCALRLAAEYSPDSGRLRLRLLRAQGPAGGALEPRAVACRLRLVLQPPGAWRAPLRAGLGRSRRAALEQDFCFDGLSEEQLRRLAVRVQAELKGRGLERGRRLGQGELLLGALLL
ncbi:C2 calcium-dependent domain-containing protein 4B [Perognathus longimembris pacificus]|uniref:C2 calcium-dependent domain-containing protein 4B n=1 Tax=Perognathus longimembris pacificus TaxID=214514 RepID=UPI0020195D75|nr:C2 calcium-dependent domain-containing protein 4B [Perognathus longimembris pacificus]XP_048188958.1 C2 calcium-dependent domain-containing protein 4B [Perognathus longimembris pacificus]